MINFNDIDGPLFIFGAPRSGTTQILRLCREVLHYNGAPEGYVWQSVKALDDHFKRIMPELDGAEGDGTDFSVFRFSREELVALYAQTLLELHKKEFGEGLLVDKTPGSEIISAAPLLRQLFPRAKFIFMKRRGIENVLSHLRRFHGRTFEAACKKWAGPMRRWLEVRDELQPDCIEIDQREFVIAPADAARRITTFLGRGDPVEVAKYLTTHFPEKTQAGDYPDYISLQNTGWDDADTQIFCDVCGALMETYNYAMHQGAAINLTRDDVDLAAVPLCRRWSVKNGNQWIDTKGPGLRLHPNEPKRAPPVLRFGGRLAIGKYRLDAEVLVFDKRCSPHQLIFSVVDEGKPKDWAVTINELKLGRFKWQIPSLELTGNSEIELRIVLDPAAKNAMYSATQLGSAVLTRVTQAVVAAPGETERVGSLQ